MADFINRISIKYWKMADATGTIDNQQSVNDRLVVMVDYFERGRKAAFARKVDISPQAAQEILAGRRSEPSFKVLVRILQAYPQIRTDWLILGNGPMLHDNAVDGLMKQPVYATREQFEKALRQAEEKNAINDAYMHEVRPELAVQIRNHRESEKANANALQEALMRVYAVGDSGSSNGGRLANRLSISEETALQLVINGKIRGTGIFSYEGVQEYDEPPIAGYLVSELAVREFLGEPIKHESPLNLPRP